MPRPTRAATMKTYAIAATRKAFCCAVAPPVVRRSEEWVRPRDPRDPYTSAATPCDPVTRCADALKKL